jgi:hypothetical protein
MKERRERREVFRRFLSNRIAGAYAAPSALGAFLWVTQASLA